MRLYCYLGTWASYKSSPCFFTSTFRYSPFYSPSSPYLPWHHCTTSISNTYPQLSIMSKKDDATIISWLASSSNPPPKTNADVDLTRGPASSTPDVLESSYTPEEVEAAEALILLSKSAITHDRKSEVVDSAVRPLVSALRTTIPKAPVLKRVRVSISSFSHVSKTCISLFNLFQSGDMLLRGNPCLLSTELLIQDCSGLGYATVRQQGLVQMSAYCCS